MRHALPAGLRRSLAGLAAIPALLAACLPLPSCALSLDGADWIDTRFPAKAQREVTIPLELQAGEAVVLDTPYGGIDVTAEPQEGPVLHATITAWAEDRATAERLLDAVRVTPRRTDRGLVVEPTRPDAEEEGHGFVGVAYRAIVPPRTPLSCRTSSGSIEAKGPLGACDAHSSYGNVSLTDVAGAVSASSSSGSIALERVRGGKVSVNSSYGDLELHDVEATELRGTTNSGAVQAEDLTTQTTGLRSGYGSIRVSDAHGDLELSTDSGSVTLTAAGQGEHRLTSGYGRVTVDGCSGQLTAKSSSGSIEVKDFQGKIDARSGYGSVEVEGVLTAVRAKSDSGNVTVEAEAGSRCEADWELSSEYGSIRLDTPGGLDARISASTAYGKIHTDQPMQLEKTNIGAKSELQGVIGRGGATVTLRTSSGSIYLR